MANPNSSFESALDPQRQQDRPGSSSEASVSAVVVNHNGGKQILACIEHLDAQETAIQEIIVVDNGSTDGSLAETRRLCPHVRIVELGQNMGPSIARNRGAQAARAATVLFVDDDVFLGPDTLTLLWRCRTESGAAAVTPRLVLTPDTSVIQLDGAEAHFVGTMQLRNGRKKTHEVGAGRQPIGAFSTSCVLIDRAIFLDVGGFDEMFFIYLEDLELGLRLHALGHALQCEANAVAIHDRGQGTPGLSFRDQGSYPKYRAYLTMRNRLQIIIIHYRFRSLLVLSPALALYELMIFAYVLKSGWLRQWAEAWLWQLRNAKSLRARRAAVQCRKQVEEGLLLSGGDLPIAAGLLSTGLETRLLAALSWLLDGYWKGARRLLGWRACDAGAAPLPHGEEENIKQD